MTKEIEDVRNGSRRPESDFSAKLDVYEDRVCTWFLDVAMRETKRGIAPGDYVALAVAVAYIEGVEHFRQGSPPPTKKTGEWFKKSATRIFPKATPNTLQQLWEAVRCGLFHSGFTEGPILLSRDHSEAICESGGFVSINPTTFVEEVNADFAAFIRTLREDPKGTLAENFTSLWDKRWEATEPTVGSS